MHICLTDAKRDRKIILEHTMVLFAQWAPDNTLVTHCVTGIRGPQGQLEMFAVKESPEEIGRIVNWATTMQLAPPAPLDLEVLGFAPRSSWLR